MPRMKLTVEYDGSCYHGFQYQKNANTVQEQLEAGIYTLTKEKVKIICAGRTDAGVHALGQVVAFDTGSNIPADRIPAALNSYLPDDIRVMDCMEAENSFNPRFEALRKHYKYYIYREKAGVAIYRNYAYCNTETLDLNNMKKACAYFVGYHNFNAFCARGSTNKTFDRTIFKCQINEKTPFWIFDISANGFLYNMARIIVGTVLDVGRGKYSPDHISQIIISRDRKMAGATVPPQGLYLFRVEYKE